MKPSLVLSKIELFPDDIFLVSYPRSGNTWISLLLSKYISDVDFTTSNPLSKSIVGEIYQAPSEVLMQMPRPRIIKLHEPFEIALPKVIYIARDARDVAVSCYYHYLKFKGEITFEESLKLFNLGSLDGFGTWNYHVNSWLDQIDFMKDKFLLIRYEDLKTETHRTLSKIINFIWNEVNYERLEMAIKASDISVLQESEKRFNVWTDSNLNINFFRKGIVGDWKNHFTSTMLENFVLFNGAGMKRLGYIFSLEEFEWWKNYCFATDDESRICNIDFIKNTIKLESLQRQLLETQEYLYHIHEELEHNLLENKKLKSQLERVGKRAYQFQGKLKQRNLQLRKSQAEIKQMKSSKFWKFRSLWIRIKGIFKRS